MARGRLIALAALAVLGAHLLGPDAGWTSVEVAQGTRRLLGWYDTVGPGRAAVAVVRLAASAACGWVAGAALLQLGATTRPLGGLGRLADRLTPALLRRLAGGVMAASISVGPVLAAGARPGGDPAGTATMVVVDPGPAPSPEPDAPAAVPVLLAPSEPIEDVREVQVELGDSFWRLAAVVVEEARGGGSSDAQIARYWRRLIEANRDRLVDPANADLLLPGQVLVLPVI